MGFHGGFHCGEISRGAYVTGRERGRLTAAGSLIMRLFLNFPYSILRFLPIFFCCLLLSVPVGKCKVESGQWQQNVAGCGFLCSFV